MTNKTITVIGSGIMGHGIGIRFAMHGFRVFVYGKSNASIKRAEIRIDKTFALLNDLNVITCY